MDDLAGLEGCREVQRILLLMPDGEPEESHLSTAPPFAEKLSLRESQTLALIAEGCTNREIANRLGWCDKTARNYVSRVLEKLGFTRRSQAAAYASSHASPAREDPAAQE